MLALCTLQMTGVAGRALHEGLARRWLPPSVSPAGHHGTIDYVIDILGIVERRTEFERNREFMGSVKLVD